MGVYRLGFLRGFAGEGFGGFGVFRVFRGVGLRRGWYEEDAETSMGWRPTSGQVACYRGSLRQYNLKNTDDVLQP